MPRPSAHLWLVAAVAVAGLPTTAAAEIAPAESTRSGEGLHDVNLGATLRTEFGPRWSGFVSTGLSRQLGPAAASPLTERANGWSVGGGVAWRF